MSTTLTPSAEAHLNPRASTGRPPNGVVERRRRKRARISAQVHIRGVNTPEPFEEVCKSVDVSRDGLLFTTRRLCYCKGLKLEVMFPYSTEAGALNQAQAAEVVRIVEQSDRMVAVGIQFVAAKYEAREEGKGPGANSFAGGAVGAKPATEKSSSVVLAVESDARTAETVRALLQQDGYTVVIVPTAKEALDVLKTTVPAVFIAEVEAEDMSGHDLCLIIKRNERLQHVPVILMTRSAQPADYSASHQLGAVVCMAKPFQPERLQRVIHLVAPPPAQKNVYGSRVSSNTIERSL
jgi:CheY-like chemotaxis protein